MIRRVFLTSILTVATGVIPLRADKLTAQWIGSGCGISTAPEHDIVLYSNIGEVIVGGASNGVDSIYSGILASRELVNAILNEAPRIVNLSDTLFPEEFIRFSVTIEATDPDNDSVKLSFPVLPSYITRNGNRLSWTPAKGQPDTFFTVIASDGTLSDTKTVYLKTITRNQKPYLTSATEDTTDEGVPYSYTATGVDPEGVPLKFYFIKYPLWFGGGSIIEGPTISGIPPEGARQATFAVIVEDDRWQDTAFITLTINSINNPPVFSSPSRVEATEDSSFTYTATAADPENENLDFWFTNLPANWKWKSAVVNGIANGNVLSGIPLDFAGSTFTVHVSDGVHHDSMEVVVNIKWIEEKPVITSPSVIKVLTGQKIFYKATATDPESGPIKFIIERKPAWCAIRGNDTIEINATAFVDAVTDSFLLIAEDKAGMRDSQFVVIRAINYNAAPKITSSSRVTAIEDSFFSYIVTVSDSDDTQWMFSYPRLPKWLYRSTTEGIPASGDTLCGIPDGSTDIDRIKIVVSDGGEQPDTLEVIIDIITKNDPPVFISSPPKTVILGEIWEYRLRAIDPENNSFVFRLINGAEKMSIDSITGIMKWTPDRIYSDTVPVTVVAVDQHGDSSFHSFSIRVLMDNRPSCSIDTVLVSRGKVVIPFTITDGDSSTITLKLFYNTSRGWEPISDSFITGKTTNITSEEYTDTLIWNSLLSVAGGKFKTRVKIVPFDTTTGNEGVSKEFILDNTEPVVFTSAAPAAGSLVSTTKRICATYIGPKLDTAFINSEAVAVTGKYSGSCKVSSIKATPDSLLIELDSFPVAGDEITVTLRKTIRDTTGKELPQDYSWKYSTAWLGDFNYDGYVDFDDLDEAVMFWYASARGIRDTTAPIISIGPVSGTVPYLRLIENDSLFDFEDLSVFLSMWRYHSSGDKKAAKTLVTVPSYEPDRSLGKIMVVADGNAAGLKFDDFRGAAASTDNINASVEEQTDGLMRFFVLKISLNGLNELITARLTLVYDKNILGKASVVSTPLFESEGGNPLILQQENDAGCDIQLARFSGTSPGADGSGEFARIVIPLKNSGSKHVPIGLAYSFVATDHKTVAKGKLLLNTLTNVIPNRFSISDLQAAPNPAVAGVRPVPFSLTSQLNERLSPVKYNGTNLFFNIDIPQGSAIEREAVSINLVILDYNSRVVVSSESRDFFSHINAGAPAPGSYQYQCYWDCRTENGLPVAPGIYRAVLRWKCGKESGKCSALLGVK